MLSRQADSAAMELIRTAKAMQDHAEKARRSGRTLALVPTMGALHDGHHALVRAAKRRADHLTVSIFVNPTQFGPGEDLEAYPRDLEGDQAQLEALGGVDVVFAPSKEQMYPGGAAPRVWVDVEGLDEHLCGRHRPGHFRGVATIVTKLFNVCRPHVGVFGQKDAQQLVILRRLVEELRMDVEIVGVPTVRESDGLASSSRNAYLSAEERRQAVVLSRAVGEARRMIERPHAQESDAAEQPSQPVISRMRTIIEEAPDARLQYAQVVATEDLHPVKMMAPGQGLLAAVAVFFGNTRLIDSAFATVGAGE